MQISSQIQQLAQMASGICGLDPNVILAQWQSEQGISSVNDWYHNNPAGITPGNSAVDALSNGTSQGFLTFATPAAGAQAYAMLYKTDPNYAAVRAAIATGSPGVELNAIWQSPWAGSHYNNGQTLIGAYNAITGQHVQIVPEKVSDTYPSAAGPSPNSIANQVVFPPTNYSIVANSQKTGDVLYGRRYRVVVSDQTGVGLDVSDLHCTFNIQYTINTTPPFATIEIYNLDPITENHIMNSGSRVVLEGGYEGNQFGILFDGELVDAIRDRPDNVSDRLTLYALTGNSQQNQAFVNFTVARGQSQRSIVTSLATKATVPTPLGELSPQISDAQLPRGKVLFGLASKYFGQIAHSNNLSPYYTAGGVLNLVHPSDPPQGTIIDLTPETGLIGAPSQNGIGVSFECLLNPSITIGTMVHIDSVYIQAQAPALGQVSRPLDSQGIYRVTSVTHTGDTRGSGWISSCTSVSQLGSIPAMLTTAAGNPN